MAAVFSAHSAVGFYKTPLSKGILGNLFIASCALNIPQLAYMKKYLTCTVVDICEKQEIWRLATSKFAFLDVKDLICGSLLIYYFRVFERRYGSQKFASFCLATSAITFLLELAVIVMLHAVDIDFFSGPSDYLSTGPYSLIFPLFVGYMFDIPQVAYANVLGVPITGKTLTYLLGLQMTSSSRASALSGICGILAGFLYRVNLLWVQDWLRVPSFLARISDMTLGRLLKSSPPQESIIPLGATLEIQRQQQFEILEQQMLLNHARQSRLYHQVADTAQERFQEYPAASPRNRFPLHNEGLHLHRNSNATYSDNSDDSTGPADDTDTSESNITYIDSQVQKLTEMGFDHEKVLQALRISNNDINVATNILLQDS